jgi:hypothetical protein
MKKIFVAFLCFLLLFNFISCNQSDSVGTTESTTEPTVGAPDEKGTTQPQPESTTAPTHQECPSTKHRFLTEEEQQTWKPYLLNTLANIEIGDSEKYIIGSFAVGLMDINFDNVPEVFAASAGGSMGNVCIDIYDLYTGEEIDPHEELYVKVRSAGEPKGPVRLESGQVLCPQGMTAIAPGQSAVFYRGDMLVGSGIIRF